MNQTNFTVYKSSAGSGKTYTLVREYLKLALSAGVDHYKHILAITFTNKAASEMKTRVLDALKGFAMEEVPLKHQSMFEEIKNSLNYSTDKLRHKSQQVFTDILHNYAEFNISTIDKFTHKIVKTFAHDLKMNIGFEVEMDQDGLLMRTVEELIADVGTDEDLTKLLIDFSEKKVADDKSWQIDKDLFEFSKVLIKEAHPSFLQQIKEIETSTFFNVKKRLSKKLDEFRSEIVDRARVLKNLIENQGIDASTMAGGTNGIYKYIGVLAEFEWEKLRAGKQNRGFIEKEKFKASKITKDEEYLIDSISSQLSSELRSILNFIDKNFNRYYAYYLWDQNLLQVALLAKLEKKWDEIKKELNIVPISDFNKAIAGVVSQQPVPFIYERIGEKYQHYLIDEFQDTSVLQWQNLLPLIENSLGQGHYNMLVGDAKQSIYRFRGGEVDQFVQLPKIHEPLNEEFAVFWEQALEQNHSEKVLEKNFRSKAEIIDFNNNLFVAIRNRLPQKLAEIYVDTEQKFNPENDGGGVSLNFIDKDNFSEINLDLSFKYIQEALNDGYDYSDIAILTSKKIEGSKIANFLSEQGIPVISPDSLLISSSQEVKVLIDMFRLIESQEDLSNEIHVIEYLVNNGIVSESYFELSRSIMSGKLSIYDLLNNCGIKVDSNQVSNLPLYELGESLMRSFGWMDQADIFLQSFQDILLNYAEKHGNNRKLFLDHWDSKSDKIAIKVPNDTQAVTLLTIHKSKGLEFPVVIHPFVNYSPRMRNVMKWYKPQDEEFADLPLTLITLSKVMLETQFEEIYSKEEELNWMDELNKLYVACTRAVDRLYIISQQKGKTEGSLKATHNMLHVYCQTAGLDTENGEIRIGKFSKQLKKDNSDKNYLTFGKLISDDWRNKIKISYQSQLVWNKEKSNAISYGNLVHEVLENINSTEEIAREIERIKLAGYINSDNASILNSKLLNILENPELKPYYSESTRVKNETTIVLPDGSAFRPDRLVFDGKEVVIIDYKTGIQKSSHENQVKNYAGVLEQMNYKIRSAFLIYLGEDYHLKKVI